MAFFGPITSMHDFLTFAAAGGHPKNARPKDEADLAAVLPRLNGSRRELLRTWIELVHPAHSWLGDLDA